WRGYPTDQRGTYFRQFWDVRGSVPPPASDADRERLLDIPPVHTWPAASRLGQNARAAGAGGQLVLLVRGALLRRYPTALVYAARAAWTPDGKRRPGTEERHPLFRGDLEPDVTFLGFGLTEAEARGGTDPKGDPGWFFVLQQPPAEPRFGLDA